MTEKAHCNRCGGDMPCDKHPSEPKRCCQRTREEVFLEIDCFLAAKIIDAASRGVASQDTLVPLYEELQHEIRLKGEEIK